MTCDHGGNYLGADNRWHCLTCPVTWPWSMADYWEENPAISPEHGLRCMKNPCRQCRAEVVLSEHIWNDTTGCDCEHGVRFEDYPAHLVEMLVCHRVFDGLRTARVLSSPGGEYHQHADGSVVRGSADRCIDPDAGAVDVQVVRGEHALLRFCDEADGAAGAVSAGTHAFVSTQQVRDALQGKVS